MNALLTTAAVLLAFLFYLLAPLQKGPGYPFPSSSELVSSFLAVPAVISAVVIFVASLFHVMRKGRSPKWLACLLMTLPYVVLLSVSFVKGALTAQNREKFTTWPRLGMYLRGELVEYHKIHPERFTYVGVDEEIRVSGFGDYLEKKAAKPQADVWEAVKIWGGEVVDPWGSPVRFGMDRDHDGYIDVEGRKHCTDHVTPPNLDYQVAVMVRTGKPPDGSGGVGAHVGRY